MESNFVGKVYRFTNENLTSYNDLYDFDNARVLSVIGSGDQYFSSLLYGAKEVELYDINRRAWDYFVLKYYSILILSYEEFKEFFVNNMLNDKKTYTKIREYLPEDTKNNLDKFLKWHRKFSKIFLEDVIKDNNNYNSGRVIPYMDKDNYYKLQNILRTKKLPPVYFYDLLDLPNILCEKYDLILTSNIFNYLEVPIEFYRKRLETFDTPEIQAIYTWGINDIAREELLENEFTINEVDGFDSKRKDYVISLKKTK